MPATFIVTDCEFDGPTPGVNSMLAFGSVAVSAAGSVLGEFEAILEPLEGAVRDEDTMSFWRRHPQGWAATTEKPEPPGCTRRRLDGLLSATFHGSPAL